MGTVYRYMSFCSLVFLYGLMSEWYILKKVFESFFKKEIVWAL